MVMWHQDSPFLSLEATVFGLVLSDLRAGVSPLERVAFPHGVATPDAAALTGVPSSDPRDDTGVPVLLMTAAPVVFHGSRRGMVAVVVAFDARTRPG